MALSGAVNVLDAAQPDHNHGRWLMANGESAITQMGGFQPSAISHVAITSRA